MPVKSKFRIPSYRLHRPSGLAVVRLDGRDVYLGKHGTPDSHAAYEQSIAEWLANERQRPTEPCASRPNGLSVNEVFLAYWRHAERYYLKDGKPTSQLGLIRLAARPLTELYGVRDATRFGPLALRAVRQAMIDRGLSRVVVNKYVGIIKRMFKWGVENELVPPVVHQGLQAVAGLRRGRSSARETNPIKPVPEADIQLVLPHVSQQVKSMIQVQMLSGMRPSEVLTMRAADLDTSGTIWIYVPQSHKTEHYGHMRRMYLGPRAQEFIRPFLKRDLSAYLFSPAEAADLAP